MDEEEYENLGIEDQKKLEKARADANNADNIRNAADVAIATKNPYAAAIGGAVKTADKVTGGKSTELLGKGLTAANKMTPGGGFAQKRLNKLNESGLGDKVGQAAALKNQAANKDAPNQVKKAGEAGGDQKGSLPSSADKNKQANQQKPSEQDAAKEKDAGKKGKPNIPSDKKDNDDDKGMSNPFHISFAEKLIITALLPSIFGFLLFVVVVASVVGVFGDFDDAVGIDATQGEETGGIVFNASSPEQQAFFDRVLAVKNDYQSQGKSVDPLKIVSVYHALNTNTSGGHFSYDSMTTEVISDIADCMFYNNVYSDETFKENLINYLIPKYLPNSSDGERNRIAQEVFDYIERYYNLIGKEIPSSCSSVGSCNYNISGFYIPGKGNVTKELNVNDLYVRLMQCGKTSYYNYGGTFGLPLEGEELVPFEKYVLGVAYAEIGPGAPEQAFKAQMIASRSFILARPFDMGGWRTLKQESDGRWVIQVAACTADQVYCDPDKGCSTVIGGNGQTSQVYSGTGHGKTWKGPMDSNSPLRQYAADVQGEVLVNNQGYIIYTGYLAAESTQFTGLAKKGYNYKQILLQVYNQGKRKYGAADIYKASCGNCMATGEYASWKQYEGEWINVTLGSSGKTIKQIGCLATSVAIQIARSGVATNVSGTFNPGTFVQYLNSHNGFYDGGNFNWYAAESVAPTFKYQGKVWLEGKTRSEKLNEIKQLVSQQNVYVVAEVKGKTGQHWVAIDSVNGDTVNMMDPGSSSTDMWSEYNWANTSQLAYYRVG